MSAREVELVALRDPEEGTVGGHRSVPLGEAFEQHRRLPFERDAPLDAQQTGGRVEPAPEAARLRRMEAPGQHGGDRRRGGLVAKALNDLAVATTSRERRGGHSPRLACGAIAARQAQRRNAPEALARGAVYPQQFAAPGRAVGAEADAVECQADDRPIETMFGHHRGDVGVMVLHAPGRDAPSGRETRGVARAPEIGMQVVCDQRRLHVEDREQVGDRLVLRHAGRRVVELADVLRHERFVAARDADGVLVVAADGDDRRAGGGEPDRARCVAAGAADELECAAVRPRAQHAVVAADHDIAIVHDEGVGNAFEPGDRFAVAGDQRLAGRIGAGHHQREGLLRVEPGAARGLPRRLVEERYCNGVYGSIAPSQASPGATPRNA